MNAAEVTRAVRVHYGCERPGEGMEAGEWACLDEFTLAPGLSGYKGADVGSSRIDLFMVRAWSSRPKGHERHAIEVKVTKADLRKELAAPHKRAPFEAHAHRFLFATPVGLCDGIDLPANVGLLEVTARGVRRSLPGVRNDTPFEVPERTFVEAFRRASRAEARVRCADSDDLAARLVAAERERTKMAGQVRRAEAARDRERDRWKSIVEYLAATDHAVPCALCRSPVVPVKGKGAWARWEHRPPLADCQYPRVDWDSYIDLIAPTEPPPEDTDDDG